MNKGQISLIILEVLKEMGKFSHEAKFLIYETMMVESLFNYVRQIKGPARGFIQMEPETAEDILENYINYRPELSKIFYKYYNTNLTMSQNLEDSLRFQIFMCRCHYLRSPDAIPKDLYGRANLWKKHYNTHLGKGTIQKYIRVNK